MRRKIMKKCLIICVGVLLITGITLSKTSINADDIINMIDSGKSVTLEETEIIGKLDLTKIMDKELETSRHNRNSTEVYIYHVRTSLSFINCTFQDDVIAYYHDEWKNETHNVVFHEDTSFKGCEFRGESAFKYSKFYKKADFSKTSYHREALFKYTKFSTEVPFKGSVFQREANFKYTEFKEKGDFENCEFFNDADFKYTKFKEGVSFKNAEFQDLANFKYTKFSRFADFEDVSFYGDTTFKYTELDGRHFNPIYK